MQLLWDSLLSALALIVSWDRETFAIVGVSLNVSAVSTLIASLVGVPAGFAIAFNTFRGKGFLITCINTLLALPTVVVGLLVYALVCRQGLLGPFDLLYTQKAMVMGQSILIIPVVTAYTIAAISRTDPRYRQTALTLGANGWQTAWVVFREARFGVVAALIGAFGRVIAEVGVSMMLGGNIRGFTRTMTTAMALEYDKGQFTLAVALGILLLGVSFGLNLLFHFFQGRTRV